MGGMARELVFFSGAISFGRHQVEHILLPLRARTHSELHSRRRGRRQEGALEEVPPTPVGVGPPEVLPFLLDHTRGEGIHGSRGYWGGGGRIHWIRGVHVHWRRWRAGGGRGAPWSLGGPWWRLLGRRAGVDPVAWELGTGR